MISSNIKTKFPEWLRRRVPLATTGDTSAILKKYELHTVCNSAKCPNKSECFSRKRATFLIMGNICTRQCRFCSVHQGVPELPDPSEPQKIAKAVQELQLKHVVITSVTRDDLPAGGVNHFTNVVDEIKRHNQNVSIEVLIPDFGGNREAIKNIAGSQIDILNHNVETVPRLYSSIRPQAEYLRSLDVLRFAKKCRSDLFVKAGLMVGVGETDDEVFDVLGDLYDAGCDIVTIGQYLKPADGKYEVQRYVRPVTFDVFKHYALKLGFRFVSSGPYVRSSYNAEEVYASLS